MSHRPNRKKLREAKQKAWEQSVKMEAQKHPIIRREAALPPAPPRIEPMGIDGPQAIYELNKRPDHRVYDVPIMSNRIARSLVTEDPMRAFMSFERFKVMQYALRRDDTTIYWWSYMPSNEALKPDISYGLRRARAYSERIRECLRYITIPTWIEKDFREWCETVIEDCEQNLGIP